MTKAKRAPKPAEPAPAGPNPFAQRHAHYTAPETRGARAVWTNQHVSRLLKYKAHGVITAQQAAAGICFEETYVYVWGTASPSRDSTIPGLGGTLHETEAQAERMAKARARLHTILNRVGPGRYSLLVSVACFGETLGRNRNKGLVLRRMLCEALDQCAIVYGINAEAA